MTGPGDRSAGDGGRPRKPRLEDLLAADEGPMRIDLVRQIGALEDRLSQLVVDNNRFEPPPTTTTRGPKILSTHELEEVRDELLGVIHQLEDLIATRFSAGFGDIVPDHAYQPGVIERLRWKWRRRRSDRRRDPGA